MSTVYIDATQLMQWQGRLTGVPRVQHELLSRFARDKNATFLYWHGHDFARIDASEVFAAKAQAGASTTLNRSLPHRAFRRAKAIAARSDAAKQLYHRIKGAAVTPANEVDIILPVKGDVLLVLEGIWRDERYIGALELAAQNGASVVQVSYDMLPVVTPQYSGHSTEALEQYASAVYPIAAKVLSISEHTKKDIQGWLGERKLTVPTIDVFRLGEDFKRTKEIMPEEGQLKGTAFILCVGTIEARKNHAMLYYVYKHAAAHGIDLPQLVIVGRKGWRAENTYDLLKTDPQVNSKVTILENASDEELAWLYSHCRFTIYPSFYEGWGLPIAESVMHGAPCLCSNTSSMPEVAGDLAEYFDPTSPQDALEKILLYLDDTRLEKARSALSGYKRTSWDECYEQVNKYIMELI